MRNEVSDSYEQLLRLSQSSTLYAAEAAGAHDVELVHHHDGQLDINSQRLGRIGHLSNPAAAVKLARALAATSKRCLAAKHLR